MKTPHDLLYSEGLGASEPLDAAGRAIRNQLFCSRKAGIRFLLGRRGGIRRGAHRKHLPRKRTRKMLRGAAGKIEVIDDHAIAGKTSANVGKGAQHF